MGVSAPAHVPMPFQSHLGFSGAGDSPVSPHCCEMGS